MSIHVIIQHIFHSMEKSPAKINHGIALIITMIVQVMERIVRFSVKILLYSF